DRAAAEVQRAVTELSNAERDEAGFPGRIAAAEEERRAMEGELEAAEAELRDAQADENRWRARSEALALALDQARAAAGAERLADIEGVVGTLADVVEVDPGWEAAFEAAAGEALAAVVVDSVDVGRRALGELR